MALALAWIFAVVGVIVAYVVSLAGAMKTVPSLQWREALVAVPLPSLGAALAAYRLARPTAAGGARAWISAAVALSIALLGLLIIAVSYFDQPGGPR